MTIKKGDKLVPMAGGLARAAKLTPEERSAIARTAVNVRHAKWKREHPEAGSEILPIKPANL